jgi:hypothetical protein
MTFVLRSLGASELGLPSYPRALPLPASWKQVVGGVELTCSWVATMGRLLKVMLATVGQNVLQPAWVSPKTERRGSYLIFSGPFWAP